jgi:hypothetical protein
MSIRALRIRCLSVILLSLAAAAEAKGQTEGPLLPVAPAPPQARPAIQLLRFDENWSSLCDPKARQDLLDPLKCIPIEHSKPGSYLSLGGEFRAVYEDVLNDSWSNKPFPVNSFWLERFQLFADTHFNSHVRLFLQLESGLEQGRPGGPRPIDKKNLDFLNAFAEFSGNSSTHETTLRVGRQELQFGSGRLMAVREGPNVRQGFYAGRLTQHLKTWTIDGFAARPAVDNPGFFDNVPLQTTSFWGVFAEKNLGGEPTRAFDAYYFGIDRKSASFNQGTAREQRQTIGARIVAGAPAATDTRPIILHYDVEGIYQFGSFGSGSINAWTVATETGVTLGRLSIRPRIGIKADISSGDKDKNSLNLQTFNPLFPIGNYFGVLSDTGTGPINFFDLHPDFRAYFRHGISMGADWLIWWRQSLGDGLYGVPGNLLVPAGESQARFVGHRPGVELRWQRDSHFYLQGDYGVFYAGPFLRESGHPHNLNYASFWTGYKF